MPVEVTCPKCTTALKVSRRYMGLKARCPKCSEDFLLKSQDVVAEPGEADPLGGLPPFDGRRPRPPARKSRALLIGCSVFVLLGLLAAGVYFALIAGN